MDKYISDQEKAIQELKDLRRRIGQENKPMRTTEKAAKWRSTVEEKWQGIQKRHGEIIAMDGSEKTGYVSELQIKTAEENFNRIQAMLDEWKVEFSSVSNVKPARELLAIRSVKLAIVAEVINRAHNWEEAPQNIDEKINTVSKLLAELVEAHENVPKSVEGYQVLEQEFEMIYAEAVSMITSMELGSVKVKESLVGTGVASLAEQSSGGSVQGCAASRLPQENQTKSELQEVLAMFKEMMTGKSSPKPQVKLPVLIIPTFYGKSCNGKNNWREFKASFESAVHNNSGLDKIAKFRYLKNYVDGEAKGLVGHFELTDENYETAWELLNNRYNNRRILVNSYLSQLLNVVKAKEESADQLKATVDRFKEVYYSLKNIGETINNSMIVHLLSSKLPGTTLMLWEQSLGSQEEIPQFHVLDKFLEGRIQTLTVIEESNDKNEVNTNDKVVRRSDVAKKELECIMCEGPHQLFKCKDFRLLEVNRRNDFVQENKLCSLCLNLHPGTGCALKLTCGICKERHNTLLHKNNTESFNVSVSEQYTLLPTALITLVSAHGVQFTAKALIDQGSSSSAITESLMAKLKWKRSHEESMVTGIGGVQAMSRGKVKFLINSRIDPNHTIPVTATILGKVAKALPKFKNEAHVEYREFPLADPTYYEGGKLDLILGSDIYPSILLGNKLKGPLLAQETHLGYIISGPTGHGCNHQLSLVCQEADNRADEVLKAFWETEEKVKVHDGLSDEEREAEKFYQATTVRGNDGRYICRLPFKLGAQLGRSRHIAMGNLLNLEKRFAKDNEFKKRYTEAMEEYFRLGHAHYSERAQPAECNYYYLPHLAVVKESSLTTKTRIVFNASSPTSNGKSLNDTLLIGPTIQNDVVEKIILFRMNRFVFVCDIVKMYRQININPCDYKYHMFLWRVAGTVRDCYLSTVTFGTASAPFTAIRTLLQLANDMREQFPIGANIISSKAYVDDIHFGGQTIEETKKGLQELIAILQSASFEVRKFASNEVSMLDGVPDDHIDHSKLHKFVGLVWNSDEDYIQLGSFEFAEETKRTKRSLLKNIARIFDPVGWCQPVIITAKLLMQKIWKLELKWDNEVPDTISDEWNSLKNSLLSVSNIKIPRYIAPGPTEGVEVHGFADASQNAYGAVIYFKINNNAPFLILAKSRVAPLKEVTIPRLELKAALLLADLMTKVRELIQKEGIKAECFGWSDSKVVLAWLNASAEKWKPFVRNRVTAIVESIPSDRWNYVASADNPADLVSRGCDGDTLINSELWFNGPTWLKENDCKYNYNSISCKSDFKLNLTEQESIEKEKRNEIQILVVQEVTDNWITTMAQKYSNFAFSCRVLAWIRRFIINCRNKSSVRKSFITVAETKEAELEFVIGLQEGYFEDELSALRDGRNVARTSPLRHLTPFLDDHGAIRVGGRIQNSCLPFDQKHPLILPAKGGLVTLIVEETHRLVRHGGVQVTMSVLRKKFWIIRGGQFVKGVVRRCCRCARNRTLQITQIMGNLPEDRVQFEKPFLCSGVDFAGPFKITASSGRGIKSSKAYVAIFVCFAVKAIHLEVVSGLSSDAFLAALSRFISRRGRVDRLYSDNGTNFVGAFRQLADINNQLAQKGIEWNFIPPLSPNFGGLWEAGVKSVKRHLNSQCTNECFTYEEFSTVLCEVEVCLNARPLCPLLDDVESLDALTPQHFLNHGFVPTDLDGRDFVATPAKYLSRWEYLKKTRQEITIRYKNEYVTRLNNRPKNCERRCNLEVGQLVLLREERAKPSEWPLGRVTEVHPGPDGLVRVVTVKTASGTKQRSLSKLCPILAGTMNL